MESENAEPQSDEEEINLLFQYPAKISELQVAEIITHTLESLNLWSRFSNSEEEGFGENQSEKDDKFQILYTKHSVHINKRLKNDLCLLIVLRISLDNILFKTYRT